MNQNCYHGVERQPELARRIVNTAVRAEQIVYRECGGEKTRIVRARVKDKRLELLECWNGAWVHACGTCAILVEG